MVREISIFPCGLEISLLLHEQSLSSYGFPGYKTILYYGISVSNFPTLQRIDLEARKEEEDDPNYKGRLVTVEELPAWLLRDEDEVNCLV